MQNKNLAAMNHVLLGYENDQRHAYEEMNILLNAAEGFEMSYMVRRIEACVERIAAIEAKRSILFNMINQAAQQLAPKEESATS